MYIYTYICRTPLQLIDLRQDLIDPLEVPEDYGFDPEEDYTDDVKAVDVDPPLRPISIEKWILFEESISPIDIEFPKSEMINYYLHALNILNDIDEMN
jgi:hypothetical protein